MNKDELIGTGIMLAIGAGLWLNGYFFGQNKAIKEHITFLDEISKETQKIIDELQK